MRVSVLKVLGLLLGLGMGACGGRGDGAGEGASDAASADTGVLGGLSVEEIQRQVQPMSPEQAESLGIVDTTIHVENHTGADSIPPLAPAPGTPTGPDRQTNPMRPSNPARPDSVPGR